MKTNRAVWDYYARFLPKRKEKTMSFIRVYLAKKAQEEKMLKKLRRLMHQRNYWRNRTRELRGRRRR